MLDHHPVKTKGRNQRLVKSTYGVQEKIAWESGSWWQQSLEPCRDGLGCPAQASTSRDRKIEKTYLGSHYIEISR